MGFSLILFLADRTARALARHTGRGRLIYKVRPAAPLSGSARAPRACSTEPCCCPSIPETVERSAPASKTSGGGPGTSISWPGLGMRKQILFCPTSCCRSSFLLRLHLRFLFSTERSCEFNFLTLLGGNSSMQPSCAGMPPSGGHCALKGRAMPPSAYCRLPLVSASTMGLHFLILQEGGAAQSP